MYSMMNTSPFQPGDRVVGYCRYSGGEEQGLKNTSTDEQEQAIRRFCEQNGLELVKVYADPFVSGRSTKGRDHYLEMMSDLLHEKRKKNDVKGCLVWDWERMHRNVDQAMLDASRLRMAGYKIYSLQQPIVDNGPFARVMEAMYMASAQNQSDMISADVRRALQSNFQKYKVIPRSCIPDGWIPVEVDMGFYSNGQPRTGYRAEPDPDLAPKIREAIDRRMHGATLEEMRDIIGGLFADRTRETVRRLMLKPLLYGSLTYGDVTIDDYCTPIIDRETFDRLQIYNASAPKDHPKVGGHFSKNRPLLSGLLFCGECGKKAFLDRRRSKGHLYETYYCNDKCVGFRREILDNLVIEKAIELLSDEQYNNDVRSITEALKTPFSARTDNSTLTAEIAKIDRKIARISAVIEDSDDAPITLVKRLSDLEKERAELTLELNSALDIDAVSAILAEADRLRKHIISILKSEKSTTEDLRNALSLFIDSVVICRNGMVTIRHTIPGMVASTPSQAVSAPPPGVTSNPQLLVSIYIIS